MALAVTLIFGSAGYLTWQQRPDLRAFVLGRTLGTPAPAASLPVTPPVAPPTRTEPAPSDALPAVPYAEVTRQAPGEDPSPSTQARTGRDETSSPLASPPALRNETPTPAPGTTTAVRTPQSSSTAGQTSPVEVAVSATEKSWVRLLSDGEKIFGGVMEAGETRRIAGSMSAVVFTGNAGGIVIQYNGRPLGAPGTRGQIRTVVFTPQNFEIRSSQPLPASTSSPGVAGAAVRAP
ncbi:MAG: DUF4115 domain-containing protein [Acidobacteria bacterium]|nr:DUF4115 domain-containing protein [Acidobacteriota bacterium]